MARSSLSRATEKPPALPRLVFQHFIHGIGIDFWLLVGITVNERHVAQEIDDPRYPATRPEYRVASLRRKELLLLGPCAGDLEPMTVPVVERRLRIRPHFLQFPFRDGAQPGLDQLLFVLGKTRSRQ